ncbi:MAG: TetR/AcrR family transcriptional regulator [candidate division WOR-3 bacterium]
MGRKKTILRVAKELFREYGFKKTTIEDIAKRSGISKSTIYHYFPSKEDILREIIRVEGDKIRKGVLKVLDDSLSPKEKLKKYLFVRFKYLRRLIMYYKVSREDFYSHLEFVEKERADFDRFEAEIIEGILREGIEKGEFRVDDPEKYTGILLKVIKGVEFPLVEISGLYYKGKYISFKEILNRLFDILMYGIGKR